MQLARASRGFNLIELMVVVAILAILAAIAIPAYQNYLIRAQVSEGMVLASGAKTAIWDFASDTGHLPPGNTSAGLPTPASISGSYVSEVEVTDGLIAVSYAGPKSNSALIHSQLLLSPVTDAGSIKWTCKGKQLAAEYLPSSCR